MQESFQLLSKLPVCAVFHQHAFRYTAGNQTAQVGIAGSTKIGEWCMFGGQVGIAGHIKIGDRVNLGAQSGVPSSIKSDNQLIGTPPMELKPYFKAAIVTKKLPDMYTELNKLRKEVEELKQLLNK